MTNVWGQQFFCGYGIYGSYSKNLVGIHLAKIQGEFGTNFCHLWISFMMQGLGIWHEYSLWSYEHAYQKSSSLAFFLWSEFIHFNILFKILSVNYGRTKKAKNAKFCTHMPMDFTYNFGKNFVPSILYWVYFSKFVKKCLNCDSDQLFPNKKV